MGMDPERYPKQIKKLKNIVKAPKNTNFDIFGARTTDVTPWCYPFLFLNLLSYLELCGEDNIWRTPYLYKQGSNSPKEEGCFLC